MTVSRKFYPSYFPKKNCPPLDARYDNLIVYRLKDDFTSYALKNPGRIEQRMFCQACGLSVFTEESDVRLLQASSKGFRNLPIVKGVITEDSGAILETPGRFESHMTWWVQCRVQPETIFVELEDAVNG